MLGAWKACLGCNMRYNIPWYRFFYKSRGFVCDDCSYCVDFSIQGQFDAWRRRGGRERKTNPERIERNVFFVLKSLVASTDY